MAGLTLEEIKQIKKQVGFTNAKLSMVSGVPLGTLNKILSGDTKNPGHRTMDAIERALLGADYKKESSKAASMISESVVYGVKKSKNQQGGYTLDDYYALPDDRRVELIDGVFYDLAAPTTKHQRYGFLFAFEIQKYIEMNKGKCLVFMAPVDVRLDQDDKTMVQPDVIIVCDSDTVKDWGIDGAPDFVAEVLSPSTKRKDRILKATKYMNAGVKEYWMIDPDQETVLIYNFADEDSDIVLRGLDGEVEMNLFHGDLKIDLSKLK